MNKLLLALGALLAGALLIPDMAEAQRGGRGRRRRPYGRGRVRRRRLPGRAASEAAASVETGCISRGGVGGAGVGMGNRGYRGAAIAARPGRVAGFGPGGRFDNRIGNGRYDGRYYGRYGRYPYYGGRNPYYGGYYGAIRTMVWVPGWSRAASSERQPRTRTTTTHTPPTRRRSRQPLADIARPPSGHVPCQSCCGGDRVLLPHLGRQSPRHRDRTLTFARRWGVRRVERSEKLA